MALSVRKKIGLGTLFLFLLLLLTGGIGIYFTASLRQNVREVLKDNYESISYCHLMQQQLDSLEFDYNRRIRQFETALVLQEQNITEPGETEATSLLRVSFDSLKHNGPDSAVLALAGQQIHKILSLNMNAMYHKSDKAEKTSENATTLIITIAAIIFIIAFTFSVNFPAIVSNPIKELAGAIDEISNKNYKHRVRIENKDEFGKLADAFNNMAARLEYFENSNLNKLLIRCLCVASGILSPDSPGVCTYNTYHWLL